MGICIPEQFEFLDLVDFGGVAFSVETVIYGNENRRHVIC